MNKRGQKSIIEKHAVSTTLFEKSGHIFINQNLRGTVKRIFPQTPDTTPR